MPGPRAELITNNHLHLDGRELYRQRHVDALCVFRD
jgi:hypothetical protein